MDNNVGSDHYVLPVSVGQEHLWLLSSIDQRLCAAYNMSAAFKITKPINRFVLQDAINVVVSRHESLRTAICKLNGALKQVVDPNAFITLQYIDFIKSGSNGRHAVEAGTEQLNAQRALKYIQLEAAKAFDLSRPGLCRVSLYRCEDDVFYLLVILHHSIADGLSLDILIKELFSAYQQILNQVEVALPPLTYQFADILVWQAEQCSPALHVEHTAYWKQKLQGVHTHVRLEHTQPINHERSFSGELIPFKVEKCRFDAIKNQSKTSKISTYALLISAFALLIHYESGCSDFLIGVPTANRDHEESWPIIGYFANTVVIRVNFNLIRSVQDLFAQVQISISEALDHQALPISKVVELLKPQRSVDFGTIFQFMFSYQESSETPIVLNNFGAEQLFVDNKLSKFDMFLFLLNQGDSLTGVIEYSTELFEHEQMLSLITHYQSICDALATDKNLSIYDQKLLGHLDLSVVTERMNKVHEHSEQSLKKDASLKPSSEHASELEERLIMIWKEVLNRTESISVQDNFFELGGNSLLVAKLVDHIYKSLAVHLPIKIIFLNPCIRKIAEYISSLNSAEGMKDKLLQKITNLDIENALSEIGDR